MGSQKKYDIYLKPKQYYIDNYDLKTIKDCLDFYQSLHKKLPEVMKFPTEEDLSEEKRKNDWLRMMNMVIYSIKTKRFKGKKETTEEWMSKDREKQEKLDNARPGEFYCKVCNALLEDIDKHLYDRTDEDMRVLFMYECPKCNKREAYFDDGKKYKSKPTLCDKCGCEIDISIDIDNKKDITTWTHSCTGCDFKEISVDDHKKWRTERAQKEKKDKELLEKYRSEFCLSEEEGKEHVETLEAMEVAALVKEEEIRKYDNQVYEESLKLKKTTIPDLETLLIEQTNEANYSKLIFEKPEIGQYVIIPFSIQDINSERTDRKSSQELEEIIKKTLKDTNWRLMSGVSYRLGYLQGRLKGYEQEEDMLKLVGKKESSNKTQTKIDPEKYSKYAHHNFVQLARIFGKHEGIDRVRKRRLEKTPDGFFLEASEGPYDCSICRRPHQGNKIWWNQYGQRCVDCWNNIKGGVIPKDLKHEYDNKGQWISEWQIKDRYGVHPATRGKLVRQGFLEATELKDSKGTIYHTLFLESENKKFLAKYPKKPKKINKNYVFNYWKRIVKSRIH